MHCTRPHRLLAPEFQTTTLCSWHVVASSNCNTDCRGGWCQKAVDVIHCLQSAAEATSAAIVDADAVLLPMVQVAMVKETGRTEGENADERI